MLLAPEQLNRGASGDDPPLRGDFQDAAEATEGRIHRGNGEAGAFPECAVSRDVLGGNLIHGFVGDLRIGAEGIEV